MQRRSFLKSVLAGLGAAAVAVLGYPVMRFLAPLRSAVATEKLAISKTDIPSGDAKEVIYNDKPIIVINRRGKGYIALSRVCTHFGCLVMYDKEQGRLVCPCHAGIFTLEGNVVSGPPPRPLERIPIEVTGDMIFVGYIG
ncbi:MAG: Rieske (2Fe-2S) protein [Nitrospirota bacterium]|jgi:cytochrome b6-f complex iron-sulfur subunit